MYKKIFLFSLLTSACSLIIPGVLPNDCADPGVASCDANILVTCQQGIEVRLDCGELACNAPGAVCGVCGDGSLDLSVEACDDGNVVSGDGCDADCVDEFCGDGLINDTNETCDDGNQVNGDGCEIDCTLSCGNGVIDAGANEVCDDGNNISGDGCSSILCQFEPGHFFEDEDNDRPDQANNLPDGDIIIHGGIIDEAGVPDVDFFALQITTRVDLRLETFDEDPARNSCDDVDTVMRFFAPDTTTILLEDDEDGVGSCSKMDGAIEPQVQHLAPGTYFVSVEDPGNNEEIPAYQLVITFLAVCGDGTQAGSEGCDDNNVTSLDGCDSECIDEFCGDGITNDSNEECDNATANSDTSPDACRTSCVNPSCGDNVIDAGEGCDDGNNTSGDGCDALCVDEFCGDNTTNDNTEACDDGNVVSGDGCNALCVDELCGDGLINDTFETCDDGNAVFNDGCGATCLIERCGDGLVNNAGLEACDDGNIVSGDGCNALCVDELCGDGLINDTFENCDNGAANSNRAACSLDCQLAFCGDGLVQNGVEACDDGNNTSNDGCSDICVSECGNSVVDGSEECDDGNAIAYDGCESTCKLTGIIDVAAGGEHSCALTSAGTVRCWGRNNVGQLGYGNLNNIGDNEAAFAGGDVNVGGLVIQLVASNAATCALLDTGSVRCWGNAGNGKLGYGNINNIGDNETPASAGDVNVGGIVIQIDASGQHTCALLEAGNIRCWGLNNSGQLGYGNATTLGDDEVPNIAGDVSLGATATQIAVGDFHTCAILTGGAVKCWGANGAGQLGYENTTVLGDNEIPSAVGNVNVGGVVVEVRAGTNSTCARLDTGDIRCWGGNGVGQLGYGNTTPLGDNAGEMPPANVDIGGNALNLSAGGTHTCAVLDTNNVRCWGDAALGRLGYGNIDDIGDDEAPSTAGDVSVGGTVVKVAAGGNHTCALLDTGDLRCWGASDFGQLGYGLGDAFIGNDELPSSEPVVPVGFDVQQITNAVFHSCALSTVGTVRCWGNKDFGRLGYGNANNIGDDETPASAGDVNIGGVVTQISAGDAHTCVLLANTGAVRCWGAGGGGRLGYGNLNNIGDNETPASVTTGLNGTADVDVGGTVIQISVGEARACALLDTGAVRCWGAGVNGRLGYGNLNNIGDNETPASAGDVAILTAAEISAGDRVSQIVAGSSGHTCALLETGAVRCWGFNNSGQLGYGNITQIGDDEAPNTAGDVSLGATATQITAGNSHTCAILTGGAVKCWGSGINGALGYGNAINIGDNELPSAVGNVNVGGAVVELRAGGSHTCALLDTNDVRCWGAANSGQIGYGNGEFIGNEVGEMPPVNVDIAGSALDLSAGGAHTCVVLSTNEVRCWGDLGSGRLGFDPRLIGDTELPSVVGDVPVF